MPGAFFVSVVVFFAAPTSFSVHNFGDQGRHAADDGHARGAPRSSSEVVLVQEAETGD